MRFSHSLGVLFDGGAKVYHYWCSKEQFLHPGAKAVVCVSGVYKVVSIVERHKRPSLHANKPVVCVFTDQNYKAWVVESTKRESVAREIAARIQGHDPLVIAQLLAERDHEMRRLLRQMEY